MTHHGYPGDVRITRMYDDACDMTAIFQAEVAPASAAVVAAPETAEVFGDIVAERAFAFPGVYDGFVGSRNGYCADTATEISIGNILPVAAAIGGLPETAARGAKIKGVLIFKAARYGIGAAAAERTDKPVFQRPQNT